MSFGRPRLERFNGEWWHGPLPTPDTVLRVSLVGYERRYRVTVVRVRAIPHIETSATVARTRCGSWMSGHAWRLTPQKGFFLFAHLMPANAGLSPGLTIPASSLDSYLSWMSLEPLDSLVRSIGYYVARQSAV